MMRVGSREYFSEQTGTARHEKKGEYMHLEIGNIVLKAPVRGQIGYHCPPDNGQDRESPDSNSSVRDASPRDNRADLRNCRPLERKKHRLSRQKNTSDGRAAAGARSPDRGEAPMKNPRGARSPDRGEAPVKNPKLENSPARKKGGAGSPRPPTGSRPYGQGKCRPCDKRCGSCGYVCCPPGDKKL